MRPLAKVCGLVSPLDAAFAATQGADLLGFVSHPPSPRHCSDLTVAVPFLDRAVLVMVSSGVEEVLSTVVALGFRNVQPYLRKEVRESAVRRLREAGCFVLLPWPDEPGQEPIPADLYLWEPSSTKTGVVGGSGQGHAMAFPPPGPFLLAGGLDASNLLQRVAVLPGGTQSRLRGADAASRLEAVPGLKDQAKVAAFIQTVHALEFS